MPKFIRLTDYKNSNDKEKGFFDPKNRFTAKQKDFSKIPGSPVAYWVSDKVKETFTNGVNLGSIIEIGSLHKTANNNEYLRLKWEVNKHYIYNRKWVTYSKGGDFKRWYGNTNIIVNWSEDARKFYKQNLTSNLLDKIYWFREGIGYSDITSDKISMRYYIDQIADMKGPVFHVKEKETFFFLLAFTNTLFVNSLSKLLNPTMSFQIGELRKLPIIFPKTVESKTRIDAITKECIYISKDDWDSRETSWEFKENELSRLKKVNSLKNSYNYFCTQWEKKFFTLHKNEEELNKLFIDIYELQDELSPEVDLKDITILKTEAKIINNELVFQKDEIIQQLISYSLGTFMGRYRLDKPGLQIAHPNPTDDEVASYQYNGKTFEIDDDAIIPLMGSNCGFSDDIVYRVKSFIELVWGEETLTENINFIEEAIGKDLEKYLINDMWKYHVKMYKKKPIYWLFSSPKGAFQVVVYMHRMNKFTVQKIRNHYLLPHINYLSREIEVLKNNETNLSNEESRRLTNLIKDELECKEYEKLVKDFADKQIEFDLDDGVTVNHKNFEGIVEKIK